MRPGRILLFLLAVTLTLLILSLLSTGSGPAGRLFRGGGESVHAVRPGGAAGDESTEAGTALPGQLREAPGQPEQHLRLSDTAGTISDGDSGREGGKPRLLPDLSAGIEGPSAAPRPYRPGEALHDSLTEGRRFRIIYYGDSQIEGDRLTSLLRRELRSVAGGTGPGMISPVMPVMYTRSYVVRSSSNWKRYTLLDHRSGTFPNNRLGPMLAVSRFTPPSDSLKIRSLATVKITPVPGADPAVSRYDRLRILYGNNNDTVLVAVRSGSNLIDFAMLPPGEGPLGWSVPLPGLTEIVVEFTGRNSPDIYALSLESDSGLVIDNVPVRGSAGLEFVMTDPEGFTGTFPILKPDLIFLQFGLNVVRNVRSEYHYYEEGLVKQVNFLRQASGGVPVVIVSVTDMALRESDTIRSFPNIRAIRDAQKRAAARSGALFWDAWESMGGQGAVLKWFSHQPPLVSRDLTHLSNAGVDTLAARILSSLLSYTPHEGGRQPGVDTLARIASTFIGDATVAERSGTTLTGETAVAETSGSTLTGDVATEEAADTIHPATDEADIADDTASAESPLAIRLKEGVGSVLGYHPDQSFIFTTAAFWIFFLVVMAGFALVHRRRAMCHTWLLAVSLYFYYRAGGLFIILLLLTTILTYTTALLTAGAKRRSGKRLWLITNIVLLLGFLSYFKYAGFFTEVINSLFNTSLVTRDIFSVWSNSLFGTSFSVDTIVLPVGISFFTFQALSYSIDVYKGRMAPERNVIDFSFYLTFFPQLVAGPIVRASEFMPQMRGEYTITRKEFGYGLFLILQGLVKKMLISDIISTGFIDRVFETPAIYSGFENLMAVYGYGLQIYCDFSGYTDIAIGVAMLMGFRLPLNFNSPYKAPNITDFWRRWHISLSRWLKDYLYIPLGGNRKGWFRTGINLMVTMLLGGLWHGAATRFVIWGGLHGAGLVVEKIWNHIFRGVTRRRKGATIAGILLTFNFVSFAWIFFRAGSMEQAAMMLHQIFTAFNPGDYGVVLLSYLSVVILIVAGYIIHYLPVSVKESYRGLFIQLPLWVQLIIAIAVAVLLQKIGAEVVQPFIYFRF